MSLSGYAQVELGNKFKPIPPKNKDFKIKKMVPPKHGIPPVKVSNVPENSNPPLPVPVPNNFVVPRMNDFVSPKDAYRRNQNLGSFKTVSAVAKVRYRDAAYVDGDRVRVYLNGKVIQTEVVLDGEFKGFDITLEKGVNTIDFEALNEGFAPPNTAEFKVYDDKGGIISASQWNLGNGFKGTLTVEKE